MTIADKLFAFSLGIAAATASVLAAPHSQAASLHAEIDQEKPDAEDRRIAEEVAQMLAVMAADPTRALHVPEKGWQVRGPRVNVDVFVAHGVVRLTGSARSTDLIERMVDETAKVAGVLRVVEKLQVAAPNEPMEAG